MHTEDIDGKTLEHWTPEEVHRAFDAGEIVLIDVRTPQEFAFEHVEGALLSPLATFLADKLPTGGDKRIVFHCGSGVRSRKVAEICAAAGLDRVAHLEGGFAAWKTAGLPYVAIDPATGGIRRVGHAA